MVSSLFVKSGWWDWQSRVLASLRQHKFIPLRGNSSAGQVKSFLEKLPRGDAVILCAACLAEPSVFVTWNTRDFMARDVVSLVDFPVVVPSDCLSLFRQWIEPFLH